MAGREKSLLHSFEEEGDSDILNAGLRSWPPWSSTLPSFLFLQNRGGEPRKDLLILNSSPFSDGKGAKEPKVLSSPYLSILRENFYSGIRYFFKCSFLALKKITRGTFITQDKMIPCLVSV